MAEPAKGTRTGKNLRWGDTRIARLARWLGTQPAKDSVDTLILEVKLEGEWQRLQTWPRSSVAEGLADELDQLVVNYANELGSFIVARVAWFDAAAEAYWTSHALRIQPEGMEDSSGQVQQAFSGDNTSAIIQTQRHLEMMVRTHVGGFAVAQRALETSVQTLSAANEQLMATNEALRDELMAARASVLELESQLEQALSKAEELAEHADKTDKQSNIIELATRALSGGQAAAPQKAGT